MKMWGFEPSRACVPLSGGNGPPKSPATGNENLGLGLANLFLGSFQALAFPYLAAAGRQKIQPQEMRIRGLGLRNCFREFSGTCAPLSGRNGPPKNPATGNENLSLAKLSQIPAGTFFSIWAFRPAKIWRGFSCFVDCENREKQLSNFRRTTKNESIVLSFIPSRKLLICSPHFFKVRGPFTLVTLSRALRARSVSERRNSCFQDGAVSSAWLVVGRFCPLVQLASGTHMAAAFPGSDLGASDL